MPEFDLTLDAKPEEEEEKEPSSLAVSVRPDKIEYTFTDSVGNKRIASMRRGQNFHESVNVLLAENFIDREEYERLLSVTPKVIETFQERGLISDEEAISMLFADEEFRAARFVGEPEIARSKDAIKELGEPSNAERIVADLRAGTGALVPAGVGLAAFDLGMFAIRGIGYVASDAAGTLAGVASALWNPSNAAENFVETRNKIARGFQENYLSEYLPIKDTGAEDLEEGFANVLNWYFRKTEKIGDKVFDATGSPGLAVATSSFFNAVGLIGPMLIGKGALLPKKKAAKIPEQVAKKTTEQKAKGDKLPEAELTKEETISSIFEQDIILDESVRLNQPLETPPLKRVIAGEVDTFRAELPNVELVEAALKSGLDTYGVKIIKSGGDSAEAFFSGTTRVQLGNTAKLSKRLAEAPKEPIVITYDHRFGMPGKNNMRVISGSETIVTSILRGDFNSRVKVVREGSPDHLLVLERRLKGKDTAAETLDHIFETMERQSKEVGEKLLGFLKEHKLIDGSVTRAELAQLFKDKSRNWRNVLARDMARFRIFNEEGFDKSRSLQQLENREIDSRITATPELNKYTIDYENISRGLGKAAEIVRNSNRRWRQLVVSQFKTQYLNRVTWVGRITVGSIGDMLTEAGRVVGRAGKAVIQPSKANTAAFLRSAKVAKQINYQNLLLLSRSLNPLGSQHKGLSRISRQALAFMDEGQKHQFNMASMMDVAGNDKGIFKAVGFLARANEGYMRNLSFDSNLKKLLLREGIDPANVPVGKIPKEILNEALERGIEEAFAAQPKSDALKGFIDMLDSMPVIGVITVPFARFTAVGAKYMWEHAPPTRLMRLTMDQFGWNKGLIGIRGELKSIRQKLKVLDDNPTAFGKDTIAIREKLTGDENRFINLEKDLLKTQADNMGKLVTGSAALYMMYQLDQNGMYETAGRWWKLKTGRIDDDGNEEWVDIRRLWPMSGYAFLYHTFKEIQEKLITNDGYLKLIEEFGNAPEDELIQHMTEFWANNPDLHPNMPFEDIMAGMIGMNRIEGAELIASALSPGTSAETKMAKLGVGVGVWMAGLTTPINMIKEGSVMASQSMLKLEGWLDQQEKGVIEPHVEEYLREVATDNAILRLSNTGEFFTNTYQRLINNIPILPGITDGLPFGEPTGVIGSVSGFPNASESIGTNPVWDSVYDFIGTPPQTTPFLFVEAERLGFRPTDFLPKHSDKRFSNTHRGYTARLFSKISSRMHSSSRWGGLNDSTKRAVIRVLGNISKIATLIPAGEERPERFMVMYMRGKFSKTDIDLLLGAGFPIWELISTPVGDERR